MTSTWIPFYIALVITSLLCIIHYLIMGLCMDGLTQSARYILLHQKGRLNGLDMLPLADDAPSVLSCRAPLTHLVLKPKYSDQTRTILWLLMSWPLRGQTTDCRRIDCARRVSLWLPRGRFYLSKYWEMIEHCIYSLVPNYARWLLHIEWRYDSVKRTRSG